MKLVWLGQVDVQRVDSPTWTRMEKLTAAGIALGVASLIWSMYQRAK